MNFTDTGLDSGVHTYALKVVDPDGNSVKQSSAVTIVSGGPAAAASLDLALGQPTSQSTLKRSQRAEQGRRRQRQRCLGQRIAGGHGQHRRAVGGRSTWAPASRSA